ncbi:hypothetical protein Tco_0671856 [Tanacetum coccineum]
MLAIPHLSQVSSMAEIDPKEAQKKSKEPDIQEKEQKESQKQANPSTEWKGQRDHSANFPKKQSFPPNKPMYNLDVLPYFFPAKPLDTLAKIISSTLLFPPSCINAMLAIPLHSQSISMAEIASKEAQMK